MANAAEKTKTEKTRRDRPMLRMSIEITKEAHFAIGVVKLKTGKPINKIIAELVEEKFPEESKTAKQYAT